MNTPRTSPVSLERWSPINDENTLQRIYNLLHDVNTRLSTLERQERTRQRQDIEVRVLIEKFAALKAEIDTQKAEAELDRSVTPARGYGMFDK